MEIAVKFFVSGKVFDAVSAEQVVVPLDSWDVVVDYAASKMG
jgi:hypothetical protein